ncbi:MAG: hypothetical protein MZV70_45720 [Desulfobacterales bacterium]|nr:hypothetical protein [Desulfobacterales bacterium]
MSAKLRDYYRQEGYYTVEITDKVEEIPRNEVALTYEIVEGEKVYIQKIEFIGNTKFKEGKLKDVMDTSEKRILQLVYEVRRAGQEEARNRRPEDHRFLPEPGIPQGQGGRARGAV